MTIKNFRPKDKDILSQPVIAIPGTKEHLTWGNLCNGSITFGNAGSGKTSGVGQHALREHIKK